MPDLDLEAAPTRQQFTILADVPFTDAYEVVTLILLEAHARRVAGVRWELTDENRKIVGDWLGRSVDWTCGRGVEGDIAHVLLFCFAAVGAAVGWWARRC